MDPDEVNKALGLILNETEEGDRVVEDSTTVQVKNPAARKTGDKIEVYYSRKTTVVSPANSDDEDVDFASDSELLPQSGAGHRARATSFGGRVGAGSDDENKKHTVLRYRRKHGGQWREINAQGTPDKRKEDDEDELEVDVKEDRSEQTGIITKTYEARWKVLKYEHLPEWLQDNEFLRHGHRPPLPSFSECFKSIWSLHTETGNIWTHLIGCVAFILLACWFLSRPDNHIQFQEKVVFSFFFVGAVLCLGLSFAFHTLSCHSVPIVKIFCKLDYMGISLLIIGSFIPWIYYGFYCRREPKITYIAMVSVLGIGAIVVSLWDKFSESRFRPIRAAVFVGMGCSGIVPTVHYIITDGVRSLFEDNSFHWLLLMAFLYLLGALLYATRTPERFFPGKCDIWFQSHQLFHTCVVIAAFVHYYGISEMAMARMNEKCPIR
uniref:Progestin and adipoQ receptor-like protein 1 n=2 Tax=Caenorhabditis japonica TaxID=281687 RepID=A0A8R1HQE5_CAEJA